MDNVCSPTIDFGGEVQLVTGPAAVVRCCADFHTAMTRRGLHGIGGRVTAEEMPVNKRVRVWTGWSAKCQDDRETLVAATVGHFGRWGDKVATEIMKFSRLDLPLMVA
jgi:hypothetical protein